MAKREILAGATDQTIDIFVQDSSSTTGAGLSGLVYNSAGLACYYRKGATGSATALTLATQTVGGAHSDGGFVEIQATNMKGAYRLDLSDTIVASAGMVTIYLYGATNMAPVVAEIEVVSVNKFDAVRMGLTSLPNAAADAAGGLPISDAGGLDLDAQIGTDIDAILVDTGTTLDGRIPAALGANGNMKADVRDFGGTAGTNSAGRPEVNTTHLAGTAYATAAAALVQAVWDALTSSMSTVGSIGKKLADWTIHSAADVWAVATRVLTAATNITSTGGTTVPQTGDSFARLGAPAGASLSADLASVKTDTGTTIPGRLPAALGANGNMKADVRDVNGAAQTATLDTIKAQTATIATDTGTTIPAAIAAVQADLPQRITKNVALAGFPFLMVDSTDHITPKTGLTVTATRSLDGAAFASCANAVSELSNGWYVISLAAADLNGNTVALKFAATGADTRNIMLVTQPT